MCDLCEEREMNSVYRLCDGSEIYICEQCGEKVWEKDIQPIIDSRLFHIIALMEYVQLD